MDFLKKNYEKVLLGVVLLGLAVAVAFLPFKIASEKQELENMRNQLIHPSVKPLTNLDLTLPDSVLKKAAAPARVDFGAPNKLFNPMLWQKTVDDRLIKVGATNIGPNALVITKLVPLYLKITLDDVTVTDSGVRCKIGVEDETALNLKDRRKQKYVKLGDKNETFAMRDIKSPPDNPTNVTAVLELNDTRQRVQLTRDQPYRRVAGHMVDLKYAPENKTWNARRVDASLAFNGEDYKIVAITENEVVLSAKSNLKKWTVKHSASPAP
ncbi:MAG TPA: hypothetical protein P5205_14895 [Candidatus Paceibacterota bacterium]|nr:hypothetical protein [Verrucomicrobiota bacterium]HSA11649.1 hypothetical protein [Candidatus Paceibacterota bacterium]